MEDARRVKGQRTLSPLRELRLPEALGAEDSLGGLQDISSEVPLVAPLAEASHALVLVAHQPTWCTGAGSLRQTWDATLQESNLEAMASNLMSLPHWC